MEEILGAQMKDDDLYQLLGCDELSSTEQINTEFKLKALDVHPDKNPDDPTAAQRFAKLQRARDILTDDRRRNDYDFWRRSGLTIPYDTWLTMKDSVHMSMHWAVKKKKDLMLEGDSETGLDSDNINQTDSPRCTQRVTPSPSYGQSRSFSPAGWSRETGNDMLQKFRNYNI